MIMPLRAFLKSHRDFIASLRFGIPLLSMWTLVAICCGAGAWAEETDTGPIEVSPCRIVLINEAALACDRAGVIAEFDVREGDRVKPGQRLVQLHDDVPRTALEIAQKESRNTAKVRFAEKASELAATEHKMGVRANELQPGSLSELELSKQKLAIDKADAEVVLAKFELELATLRCKQAEAELKAFQITAPFAGIVTRVHRRLGEAVRQGDPVVEIVATEVLRVEGYLPIRSAWQVKVGDAAQVRVDVPGEDLPIEAQVFPGQVVFIDPKSQPVDGGVRVYVEVDNSQGLLRAGAAARMTIAPKQKPAGAAAAPPIVENRRP